MRGRPRGQATQAMRVLRVWQRLATWHRIEDLAADERVHVRTLRRDLAVIAQACGLGRDEAGRFVRAGGTP